MSNYEPITFTYAELPGAPTIEQAYHNQQQLIMIQLAMLRVREGAEPGQPHTIERELPSTSPLQGHVAVQSVDARQVQIRLVHPGGGRTIFDIDSATGTFSSQPFAADAQPAGDITRYKPDADSVGLLGQLHRALFDLNNLVSSGR